MSSISPENFYRNEDEVLAGLAAVYSEMRSPDGSLWAYYNLSEISTDEMIVPTRGQDWFDNGRWLEIHRQGWSPTSTSGNDDVNRVWVDTFRGIARANVVLGELPNVAVADKDIVEGELRGLRAFYYYLLLDMFGGVPIATTPEIMPRPRSTRAELFQFIEDELLAARELLPPNWPASDHGRFTQGAADAILASMYLNAEVFTGEVTTGGLTPGQPRWQDAIDAADRILNSGEYSLASDFHSNFIADNELSPENILVAKHLNRPDLGLTFLQRSLHYNQLEPDPWNGFATLAETYYAFDQDDDRTDIFLVGPQFQLLTGEPIDNRQGQRLVYTPEIQDATQATEAEGARIVKYPPDPNHVAQNHGNDFAWFRLAEIYLIKAEALFELGNSGAALALVNTVRERSFEPPEPLAAIDSDVILRERLFELTAEAKRRQDLIRHGTYTSGTWAFKQPTDAYRILMPIPQAQMDANPELVQNPGY
ncbi:MAG: RagB/SusD family nutrient uptake outer membrane protein [Gemmatimonadaceae bacterium]